MSPKEQHIAWRRTQPDVGCAFARLIAARPEKYGQRVIPVSSPPAPSKVAKEVAEIVTKLISDKSATAAALVFPNLTTLEGTAAAMLALDEEPLWGVTTSTVKEPSPGEFVALHVVREIPFGEHSCPSEALVFGNFPEFPPTRCSPVTALELFVGELRPRGPLDDKPTTKGNLAHIELNLPTHEAFLRMWSKSVELRAASLGGEDNRAKAKVSMVITPAIAEKLGCAP